MTYNRSFSSYDLYSGHSPATAVPIPHSDDEEVGDDEPSEDSEEDTESDSDESANESDEEPVPTTVNPNGHIPTSPKLTATDPDANGAISSPHSHHDNPPHAPEDSSEDASESSSASSSDDEEEDEEPALKYEKLGSAAPELFLKDSASALTVSARLMVRYLPPFSSYFPVVVDD